MEASVELYNEEARVGTFGISVGFGRDHYRVLQLISKYEKDFLDLENNRVSNALIRRTLKTSDHAGRPVEEIMLNEQQAIFLGTLFRNTDMVVEFKKRLSKEFVEQKNIIANLIRQRQDPDWQNVRKDGKIVYRQKTDVIKQFVEYATSQGSKSAEMYYANFAKMENSALFYFEQKYKNMREVLTIKQLMQISTADDVIEKALKEGMESGLNYKNCYKLAKERIIAFAEIIGRSPIIELTTTPKGALK